MIRAAVYCRVSTDSQEREGTSLQTQLENCLTFCQGKGYEAAYRFSETYSGLSLERPELDKLRELVRNKDIDILVCYSLDRLTRDPGHGVIITQELEKHKVNLEVVTEDVDNSELGKLIVYVKSYASKLEAEKIRERTMRGKRAAKAAGRIYCGAGPGVYGYDYLRKIKGERQATRTINETEAKWVKEVFNWLVSESLSTNAITYRLRALGAPTKAGKVWGRSSVIRMLKNPAYAGKANATPAIISPDLFEAAQRQLKVNSAKSPRNCKHEYLLRGHIRCKQCGKSYTGEPNRAKTYYRCLGRRRISLTEKCHNKVWLASRLEALVWNRLVEYFSDKDFIMSQIKSQHDNAGKLSSFQTELELSERQIRALDREQHQLLQWALKGFPESQVEAENKRINKDKDTLKARINELQNQIRTSQDAIINETKLTKFVEYIQSKLPGLDYEGKRLALEWLGITAWIDGEDIEITGIIETKKDVGIATTTILSHSHNTSLPFSLKITAKVV